MCLFLALAVLSFVAAPYVLGWAADVADRVDKDNPANAVYFMLALWATTNPLVPGYTLVLLAIGFVYGFWPGLPMAWVGAALSGWSMWWIFGVAFRSLGVTYADLAAHRWVRRWSNQILAVGGAVADDPYRLTLLLQLTFLPYGGILALLSITPGVESRHMAFSSALGRVKVVPWVAIGVVADSVREAFDEGLLELDALDWVVIVAATVFSVLAVVVLSLRARDVLRNEVHGLRDAEEADGAADDDDDEEEEEEKEAEDGSSAAEMTAVQDI